MAAPVPGDGSIVPLFQTRTFLLSTIRMQSASEVQTLALIDQAITDVRLEFFTELGTTRTLEIAGYTYEANPTSANSIVKANAIVAEAHWVTYKLVPLLPQLFIENQHTVNETFNEEPLTRDASKVQELMDTLWKIIQSRLGQMKEPTETGDGVFASALIERQDDNGDADPYIVYENFIGLYPGAL